MKQLMAVSVSMIALVACILPACLYFGGLMGQSAVTSISLLATVIWFVATPLWMGHISSHSGSADS